MHTLAYFFVYQSRHLNCTLMQWCSTFMNLYKCTHRTYWGVKKRLKGWASQINVWSIIKTSMKVEHMFGFDVPKICVEINPYLNIDFSPFCISWANNIAVRAPHFQITSCSPSINENLTKPLYKWLFLFYMRYHFSI